MYFIKYFLVISFMNLVVETRSLRKRSICHVLCGTSVQWNAGVCQLSGSCLCRWGWTGPNGVYINVGTKPNLILADYCTKPCHFTHNFRNRTCGFDPTSTTPTPTTVTTTQITTTTTPQPNSTITTTTATTTTSTSTITTTVTTTTASPTVPQLTPRLN